jgi:hypothetical protein
MHMGVDTPREREAVLRIEDLFGLLGLDVRPKPGDLSIRDRNIEAIDRRLVRANHAGILDDGIENLVHTRQFPD